MLRTARGEVTSASRALVGREEGIQAFRSNSGSLCCVPRMFWSSTGTRRRVCLLEKVIVCSRTPLPRQEESAHSTILRLEDPPIPLQSGTQALLQTLHLLPLPGPVKPTLAPPACETLSIGHRRTHATSSRLLRVVSGLNPSHSSPWELLNHAPFYMQSLQAGGRPCISPTRCSRGRAGAERV